MALRADDVDLGRDRLLVEHFQEGDQVAFEDLYRRYFGRVYRFCLRRVGDRHEAEELAQEAFARAYRALPTLSGERRFYPWITVIASRLCVDSHRRRARTEPSDTIDLGVVEGGQDRIVDAADTDLLGVAFGRLASSHREVLKLREHEEWSYQHIADHLGVTLGTVEARLFRARQALRREFAAVAGPDSGLAAIPVIGWVLRRFVAMRHRAAEWAAATNLAPALGGVLAAATVVVGATAVGLSTGNHPTPAAVSTARPTATAAGAREPADLSASTRSSSVAAAGQTTTAAGSDDAARVAVRVPAAQTGVSPASTGYDHTTDAAAQAPISQTATTPITDRVTVGVNPDNALSDVQDDIDGAQTIIRTQSRG